LFNPKLFPVVSIVDPALTLSCPASVTGDGGIDILSHVLDPYITSTNVCPLADRMSESIMITVIENLDKAIKNGADIKARENLSWASTVALCGMPSAGRGGSFPLHVMEHSLSGYYDISHGKGLACLMNAWLTFSLSGSKERLASIAQRVFYKDISQVTIDEAAQIGLDALMNWLKNIGQYVNLSELDIDDTHFGQMADDAIKLYGHGKDYIENQPMLDRAGIIEIYRKSLS